MQEYTSSGLFLLTIIIVKCACMDANNTSIIFSNLTGLESGYNENPISTHTLKEEQSETSIKEVKNLLKRTSRDLRIPFRAPNRNVGPNVSPRPNNQRPPPPRVFSHPKLRQGASSDLQAQQQQYRPAYAISQGSGQKSFQQGTRTQHRNNQPVASRRPQEMARGPLRLPGKDMVPVQHTQRPRFSNSGGRQRTQWRQSSPHQVPAELLHSSSSDNIPRVNGKAIKPEARPPTRDRVIDVFHHIPVSPTPNPNIYPRVPPIIHTSSTPFQKQNPFQNQPYFKQSVPASFVSPQPSAGLQVPHQPVNVLQDFPGTEYSQRNVFGTKPEGESPTNMHHRRPVVIPQKLPSEINYPFEHKFVQSEPLRDNDEHLQGVPNLNRDVIDILPQFNPTNKEQFQTGSFEESHSLSNDPADSISIKDLIVDAEKLRVIHTVEENPANKSGTVKKYWNFRQENFGLQPPKLSAEPIYPKVNANTDPPIIDNDPKNGEPESLISHVEKNHQIGGSIDLKVVNDEIRLVASHMLPTNGYANKKLENISKEFYYIDNQPKIKVENAVELPPNFMHVVSGSHEQTLKRQNSSPDIERTKVLKASDNPIEILENMATSKNPEITTNMPIIQNIAQHLMNHKVDTRMKSENLHNVDSTSFSSNDDQIVPWNHNLKYIPADIFRTNITTENKNVLKDHSPGEISSDVHETNIENYEHSSGSGLYARNKAQFQKFEDSIPTGYPFHDDSMTSEIQPKQYFRGPQHYNNWTVFDDHPISNFGHRKLISTSVSYLNSWLSNPTTALPPGSVTRQTHTDDSSGKQVLNAWHLANKVFGRKNYTRKYSSVTPTTMKPEHKRVKFTYASLPRSTTESVPEISSKFGAKKFFNFRTGTTASTPFLPDINSENPVTLSSFGEFRIPNEHNTADDSSIPQTYSRAGIANTPKPNSGLERMYRRRNQSALNENRKPYYINLKPVTRPYSSSSPSHASSAMGVTYTLPTQKLEPTEAYSSLKSYLNTESTVRKFGVAKHETTSATPQLVTYTKSKVEEVITSSPSTFSTKSELNIDISSPSSTIETREDTTKSATFEEHFKHTDLEAVETVTKLGKYLIPSSSSSVSPSISTPSVSTEIVTTSVNQEQVVVESLKSMKLKMQEMMSKGMRHFMPLVMEMSSDVALSSDCTFSLLRLLRGVRSLEQWAIRMMDASSKVPEGILFGTFSTFGSYDECIAIKTPKTNLQIPYTGKYCSINIQPALPENERHFTIQKAFRRYPKLQKVFQEMHIDEDTMAYYYILKHRLGLCIPSTCTIDDLHNVTDKLAENLMMKITVGHCETSEKPSFTKGQIISMCGVFIAFFIVVIGTILDMFLRHRLDHDMDIEEVVRKKSFLRQFSYAFSAYRNACKILNTSIPSYHLSSLHGIKFLSMTWIMLGHVYYCKDYLTVAGLNKVRDLGANLAFQVVLNSGFAADTFFFLSGFLVVYSTFQYLETSDGNFSIVGFYIKRYCRLTPAFLMISGVILLGPLIGSGPVWNETLEPFVTGCENYWWTNLFYFSNFVPTAKTCVPHGWFLSCDMQFYLISPIIILGLYRRPRMGLLLIAMGVIISMVSTGFLTFIYSLPPVSLFSLPDPKDINDYLDTMGYKPYAHYAPYCIGMAVGFALSAKQKITISRCMQVFGWLFTITTCLLVVYGTWDWNSGNLPDWSLSVAYATSSRTVWTMGVAWITVVCYAGYGGTVNDILSWHGFIPLSRLCYLAYLIHPLLMYLYASYIRSPVYFSQYVLVYLYFGHLCVTFGLAFVFSLAFELPFLNLEKIVSRRLDQNRRKRRASFSHHHTNWQHPEYPEIKDSVVLMRRRADFTHR